MSEEIDLLDAANHLSPKERAAAIAHWVYTTTTKKGDSHWRMRVAEAWDDLDKDAREFNLDAIDTWARFPAVFDAWVKAVSACRESGSG